MMTRKDKSPALSWADLGKLFAPESGQDRQEIVRQLIVQAAHNARQGTVPQAPAVPVDEYEEALRRAVQETRETHERLAEERRDAERLWNLLQSHPPTRRRFLIRNDRRLQTWGFYECLRERSQHLLEREPGAVLEAADLALTVAQCLSPALYGEERVYDFQAEALIVLAQARRVGGDLEGAATALDQARAMLAMGTGDLLERAELESARAALLRDLGHPEEAEEAVRKAERLAHRVGGPKEPDRRRSLEETDPGLRSRRRVSR